MESSSRPFWTNEIIQLVQGPVKTAARLRAAHGLFSALENCTDIVQMTDKKHKVRRLVARAGPGWRLSCSL